MFSKQVDSICKDIATKIQNKSKLQQQQQLSNKQTAHKSERGKEKLSKKKKKKFKKQKIKITNIFPTLTNFYCLYSEHI